VDLPARAQYHRNRDSTSAGRCARGRHADIAAPSKGMSSHFRIGPLSIVVNKERVAAVFAGPVIPRRDSQVPTGVSYDVRQSLFPVIFGSHNRRVLALLGGMTSLPDAFSRPRFFLGTFSATCLPLGIPTRTQFRAYTKNIISIERLRSACSLSLGDPGRWLPCCYVAPLLCPVETTQSTQNG